jgi:hypothetical protein
MLTWGEAPGIHHGWWGAEHAANLDTDMRPRICGGEHTPLRDKKMQVLTDPSGESSPTQEFPHLVSGHLWTMDEREAGTDPRQYGE